MPMQALAVDLQLLRSVMMPDLRLSVGRTLMARVAALEPNGRGTISLAGVMLEAELPKGVAIGQELKLQVRELTPEKVVLGLQERPPVLAQPVTTPMPGGGAIEIKEQHESSGGGAGGSDVHTLSLVYDAPSLGPIDLQFALDPASLRVVVTLAAGAPHELALGAADALGAALSTAVDRSITVSVKPRHEPIDVYA